MRLDKVYAQLIDGWFISDDSVFNALPKAPYVNKLTEEDQKVLFAKAFVSRAKTTLSACLKQTKAEYRQEVYFIDRREHFEMVWSLCLAVVTGVIALGFYGLTQAPRRFGDSNCLTGGVPKYEAYTRNGTYYPAVSGGQCSTLGFFGLLIPFAVFIMMVTVARKNSHLSYIEGLTSPGVDGFVSKVNFPKSIPVHIATILDIAGISPLSNQTTNCSQLAAAINTLNDYEKLLDRYDALIASKQRAQTTLERIQTPAATQERVISERTPLKQDTGVWGAGGQNRQAREKAYADITQKELEKLNQAIERDEEKLDEINTFANKIFDKAFPDMGERVGNNDRAAIGFGRRL